MTHSDNCLTFKFAAKASDVPAGSVIKVEVDGVSIALFNVDGEFFALDEICTHAHASLVEGYVEGSVVECPLHGATFCIHTGRALTAPATEDLVKYAVRVENGQVLVGMSSTPLGAGLVPANDVTPTRS
jgi:nitrite reductase/ring-hydroxylating ferredoxin subunit